MFLAGLKSVVAGVVPYRKSILPRKVLEQELLLPPPPLENILPAGCHLELILPSVPCLAAGVLLGLLDASLRINGIHENTISSLGQILTMLYRLENCGRYGINL